MTSHSFTMVDKNKEGSSKSLQEEISFLSKIKNVFDRL